MLTERQIRLQEVCEFLDKHNWLKIESGKRKIIYQAPESLGFTEPCKICLPANFEFTDFDKSLDRNINFIAEVYDISPREVSRTVKAIDTILSIRMIGEKTSDGTLPVNSLKDVLDNITSAIKNAASFVVSKNNNSEPTNEFIDDYIKKCRFLQTEVGSFIIKIQLPSNELLKEGNLLTKRIYSDAVGNEISSTIGFVNDEIFNGDYPIESDAYLANNYQKHSSKILNNIFAILEKSDVDEIEFSFIKNGVSENKIRMADFKDEKLQKLKNFNSRLSKFIKNTIDIDTTGKITELSSKDPSGDENKVIISCGNKKLELNLNKSDYRKAVDAHLNQSDVKIKGLANKGTKNNKITRLDSFEVCD